MSKPKKTKPALAVVPEATYSTRLPDTITLSGKEAMTLRQLEQQATAVKCAIADAFIAWKNGEKQLGQLVDQLNGVQENFRKTLNKTATLHGIDVDASPTETGENWSFSYDQMTFTRVPVPGFVPPGAPQPEAPAAPVPEAEAPKPEQQATAVDPEPAKQ